MIFAGVPMSFLTVLTCIAMSSQLEHVVGEKAVAYVVYGTIMLVAVLGMITYNVTPKRLILPLGIIGWLISASILCWYASVWPRSLWAYRSKMVMQAAFLSHPVVMWQAGPEQS